MMVLGVAVLLLAWAVVVAAIGTIVQDWLIGRRDRRLEQSVIPALYDSGAIRRIA